MCGVIAVVGRSGQVAQALVRIANERGIEIVSGGRPDVDLANPDTLKTFIDRAKPNVMVNAAAYTAVDKAEDDRDMAFDVNARGPGVLASLCAERDIPVIHVSTDYVFDGSKTAPYVEDDLRKPLGVYGASKAAGEVAVGANAPRHIILRTAWVYGLEGSNFVRTMLRLGQERDELGVVDDQVGTPTHADDIAAAIVEIAHVITALPVSDSVWGTYHFAGGGETTWHGFAREIFRLASEHGLKTPALKAITTADYPTRAQRPAYTVLDCSKLSRAFGIKIAPWEETLARKIVPIVATSRAPA